MQAGMKKGGISPLYAYPLYLLQMKLAEERKIIPKMEEGNNLVYAILYPFLNTSVTPNHSLMGVTKYLFELFFNVLPDDDTRNYVDF